MRTLYLRIVLVTLFIMTLSSVLAFITSNIYYQNVLKPKNDEKNTQIAKEIVTLHDNTNPDNTNAFFTNLADLGYQLYITDSPGEGDFYGAAFRETEIDSAIISSVLSGEVYHGMLHFPSQTFVTGFFANELKNSIGVPIEVNGERQALFMRPDVKKQFGEIQILLAVLLLLTIFLSILFVFISTRYIVNPIKKFTNATKKIANGDYETEIKVNRKDEIGTLAQSFTKMSSSLKQLDDMRQEFVSNVSHEIQSPLASIKGYTHIMRTKHLTTEEHQNYLQIIESESTRLSRLSKQLLTLAALDKDANLQDLKPFDLSKQIADVVRQTAWSWQNKDIAVDLDLPDISYVGEEKLLYQVWENLIVNSIKYTNPGGKISIKAEDKTEGVLLTVSDNGVGINESDQTKLFDRFYKVDKSRSKEKNSSGLGLSIVKKIIDLHRGDIVVESTPGKGTTFKVYLP